MKKISVAIIAVTLVLFFVGASFGFAIMKDKLFPSNLPTEDIFAGENTEDEIIFEKPSSPTPTTYPDVTVTPDVNITPDPDATSTPTPVPTPTPNPEDYYKNPYITQANTTFVYDTIYKSGKAQQSDNSYNFLILVPDWSSGCTDSIIVVNINQDSGKITTLSIPRDAYVKLPNGKNGKINEIYCKYGISKLCDYIKGFTGIDINYYAAISPESIIKLIDAVGGINYNIPVDIPHLGLQKGVQHLDGAKAVSFLRFRNFYYSTDNVTQEQLAWFDGRDINRVKTAIGMLQAFAEQKFTLEFILNMNSYINIVLDNAETNVKSETLLSMVNIMWEHFDKIVKDQNINSYYLGGQYNSNKYTNQYGSMWVWEVNDCMVNYNNNKAYYTTDIFGKMFKTKYKGLASY